MLPTNTIQEIKHILETKVLPLTCHYHREQLKFGILSYGLRPFQSIASNSRSFVTNPHTALRKAERLFANESLAVSLGAIYDGLYTVKPSDYLNLDHSNMNLLTALVGAIQTRKGRALPCLIETTYAHNIPSFGSRRFSQLKWNKKFSTSRIGRNCHLLRCCFNVLIRCYKVAFKNIFGDLKRIGRFILAVHSSRIASSLSVKIRP